VTKANMFIKEENHDIDEQELDLRAL